MYNQCFLLTKKQNNYKEQQNEKTDNDASYDPKPTATNKYFTVVSANPLAKLTLK
jgi:hypothetical protein